MCDKEVCVVCEQEDGQALHTCPYKEELYGDYDSLCNCCKLCEGQCIDDI